MGDRDDQDWDPIPPVNPFFKGVVVLVILWLLALAAFGAAMLIVAVLT